MVDLIGKGGHIRTVPIPNWVKAALDQWTGAANVTEGRIFRRVAERERCGAKGYRRTSFGTWSERAARKPAWSTLRHTICREPVQSCVTTTAESWSRFSFCWGTYLYKRQNTILGANKTLDIR